MSFTVYAVLFQNKKSKNYKRYKDYTFYNNHFITDLIINSDIEWIQNQNYKDDLSYDLRRPAYINKAIEFLKGENYKYFDEKTIYSNNIGDMYELLEEMKGNDLIFLCVN